MICMSARDVVESTGATLLVEGKRPLAGEMEIDSRRVGEGSLFVAFAGENRSPPHRQVGVFPQPKASLP